MAFQQAAAALDHRRPDVPSISWDETLLPRATVAALFRQWLRDKAATRKFLTVLFAHLKKFHEKGSTGRRAILIASTARELGWKPRAHTQNLVDTGDIRLGNCEFKAQRADAITRHAEYVGRSIRRLRKHHKRSERSHKKQL